MTWRRVDPRHLRQRTPDGVTVVYVDDGERDVGHLLVVLDSDGRLAAFQLSWEPLLAARELVAEWSRERGVRVGVVDSGREGASDRPRVKPSPLVRYYARPPAADVEALLEYVVGRGNGLPADLHAVLVDVLRAAMRGEPDGRAD